MPTKRKRPFANFIYQVFLIALVIDIGGSFGLKYAMFVVLVVFVASLPFATNISIPVYIVLVEGALFVLAPIVFLFISVCFYSINLGVALGQLTPFAMWFLYPVLLKVHPKEKIISLFANTMFCGALLSLFVFCIIFIFYFQDRIDLVYSIHNFANIYNLGYFGQKNLSGRSFFFPNVYFRWTLLLVPTAVILFPRNKIKLIIVIVSVLTTVSTGAIVFLIFGLVLAYCEGLIGRPFPDILFSVTRIIPVFCVILVLIYVTYLYGYGDIMTLALKKLSGSSESTAVKIGHIKSIINILSNSETALFFGMGVGSEFYSIGSGSMVINVEVSHFNMVRQFGLPYGSVFTIYVMVIFLSLRKVGKDGKYLAIGLIALFLAAGTNPLLISPVFFLLLVISRAYITLSSRDRHYSKMLNVNFSTRQKKHPVMDNTA